jgi:hypothetical protein
LNPGRRESEQGLLDRGEADPFLLQADGGRELGGHQILVERLLFRVEEAV